MVRFTTEEAIGSGVARFGTPLRTRVLMMPRHLLAEDGAALDLAQDVRAGTASLADELVVADVCND